MSTLPPTPPAGTQIVVIARKRCGREKEILTPAEAAGHEAAKLRLEATLERESSLSTVREVPDESTRRSLDDLLVRLRLTGVR